MRDPRRLLKDASGVERDLLRAGMREAPPPTAKGRAAVALGLPTGAVVTATAATSGASAAATKATWLGMSAATVKVLGVCVVSGAIAAATVQSVRDRSTKSVLPVTSPASSVATSVQRIPTAMVPALAPV